MIRHMTSLVVSNVRAEQFYDFMINPNSNLYRAWWPEEHLDFHITKPGEISHLGDEVYYDEYLGETRRMKFFADVVIANRPNNIVRHKDIKLLRKMAEYLNVPVINAMTDVNHPCEVLTDMYALSKRRADFTKDKYLFVGKKGNIGLAWKEASEVMGFQLEQS